MQTINPGSSNTGDNTHAMSNSNPVTIVSFLRSDKWAFISFVLIVTPLMVHTSSLIIKVSGLHFDLFPGDEMIYSVFFALGFDTAILTFALSGREKEASGLAWIVFFLNFGFLNYSFIEEFSAGKIEFDLYQGFMMLIRLIVSATGAYIVHAYVMFFLDRIKNEEKLANMFSANKRAADKIIELTKETEAKEKRIAKLEAYKKQLEENLPGIPELSIDLKKDLDILFSENERYRKQIESLESSIDNKGILKTKVLEQTDVIQKDQLAEEDEFVCDNCKRSFKALSGLVTHSKVCKPETESI